MTFIRSGGGGGNGVTLWTPDSAPSSPATEDDEFDTGSLDAKWSELDNNSNLTVSVEDYGLVLDQTPLGGDDIAGIYQDAPGLTDYTVWAKVSDTWQFDGLFKLGGIMLAEDLDANPTTANIHTIRIAPDNTPNIGSQRYNAYNSFNSTIAQLNIGAFAQRWYIRARVSGSDLEADFSLDGSSWFRIHASSAINFTPDKIGLFTMNRGASTAPTVVDWFRVTSSSDFDQSDSGRLLNL